MSRILIHNGISYQEDTFSLSAANRSFRYGDGFFETMRMEKSKAMWVERHIERMRLSAGLLHMKLHPLLSHSKLADMLTHLYQHNHPAGEPARIWMGIYRNEGGLYAPDEMNGSFLIESKPLDYSLYPLNTNGLYTDLYPGPPRHANALSRVKTTSALPFVMAAIYKQEKGLGDCFILNTEGGIAEACSSNVFLIKDQQLFTPGLDQGCISGIMRAVIIDLSRSAGYEIRETILSPPDLENSEELFLTNTISGIRWVAGFRQKRYRCEQTKKLSAMLNKHALRYLDEQAK